MGSEALSITGKELERQIRFALQPDNPALISHWLTRFRCCQRCTYGDICCYCSIDRQRSCYEYQCQFLMDTALDELLPGHWRHSCLDQLHQPKRCLQRLASSEEHWAFLRAVSYELSISATYFY